ESRRRWAVRTAGAGEKGSAIGPSTGTARNERNRTAARSDAIAPSRHAAPGSPVSGAPAGSSVDIVESGGRRLGMTRPPHAWRLTPGLVRRVRQQGDGAGTLDRRLQLALVQRAGPRDAPRQDLAAIGDEGLEKLDVLPVHVLELLRAELADLAASDEELLACRRLPVAIARATASGTSGHRAHDSLLSAAGAADSAAAGGAGRGGRFAAFFWMRTAIFAE